MSIICYNLYDINVNMNFPSLLISCYCYDISSITAQAWLLPTTTQLIQRPTEVWSSDETSL